MTDKFSHGYALLIGVGESAYPKWSLPVTVKDMQALRAILTDPALCGYPDDDAHIRLLHDAGATKQAILDGLAWLAQQTAADSDATAVVFYSGHGWVADGSGKYYLLPHDVEPFDLAGSALPAETFTAALRQVKAKRLLAFVDSCHAAGMATAKDQPAMKLPSGFTQTSLPKGLVEELKQGAGRAVFSSSTGAQQSWVRPDGSLSLYTYHLIEALQGAGNQPGDTTVRVSNLMSHLGKAVPESARTLCQAEQTPFFDTATEDFPVALLLGGKGLSGAGFSPAQGAAAPQPTIQASGERSVAAGTISDSTIVTGNDNMVQQGKYNINIGNVQGLVIGDQAQVTQVFGERLSTIPDQKGAPIRERRVQLEGKHSCGAMFYLDETSAREAATWLSTNWGHQQKEEPEKWIWRPRTYHMNRKYQVTPIEEVTDEEGRLLLQLASPKGKRAARKPASIPPAGAIVSSNLRAVEVLVIPTGAKRAQVIAACNALLLLDKVTDLLWSAKVAYGDRLRLVQPSYGIMDTSFPGINPGIDQFHREEVERFRSVVAAIEPVFETLLNIQN